MLFQTFKERGFDLEGTHLQCSKKLSKLLVFVSIAVALCVKIGEHYHGKVQKIRLKKHGYKSNSFFRTGLNIVRRGLKNITKNFILLWQDYIAIFTRWIELQITYNQLFKKIIG